MNIQVKSMELNPKQCRNIVNDVCPDMPPDLKKIPQIQHVFKSILFQEESSKTNTTKTNNNYIYNICFKCCYDDTLTRYDFTRKYVARMLKGIKDIATLGADNDHIAEKSTVNPQCCCGVSDYFTQPEDTLKLPNIQTTIRQRLLKRYDVNTPNDVIEKLKQNQGLKEVCDVILGKYQDITNIDIIAENQVLYIFKLMTCSATLIKYASYPPKDDVNRFFFIHDTNNNEIVIIMKIIKILNNPIKNHANKTFLDRTKANTTELSEQLKKLIAVLDSTEDPTIEDFKNNMNKMLKSHGSSDNIALDLTHMLRNRILYLRRLLKLLIYLYRNIINGGLFKQKAPDIQCVRITYDMCCVLQVYIHNMLKSFRLNNIDLEDIDCPKINAYIISRQMRYQIKAHY